MIKKIILIHNNNGDIMNLIYIISRTIFFYFFTIFIFRIMVKKEIKQLTIEDLVVSLLIANICAISIENYNDSILYTVLPIIVLLLFEIINGYLCLKFNKLKRIIDGKPSLIINGGVINHKEMVKQRYSLDDLLLELRNNSIKDLTDVEYAVLENNGNLSIFKYDNNKSIPFPLIVDGYIERDSLKIINKDEGWLLDYLNKRDILLYDVFYAFYKNDKLFIILKSELNN